MPSSTPAIAPMATAMTPTAIDVRAPAITRASTSRPYWSVPKGWSADGDCKKLAELEAGDRPDGNERVAERVPGDDDALGHAFRSRGTHVILAQHVEHGRARGAHEHGGLEQTERERGQDERADGGHRP